MPRLLQFTFLIGGMVLLVMTAAVTFTRQDEALQWMIYEDDDYIYWLHPDSRYEQAKFPSPDVYQTSRWTLHNNQFYFVMWTASTALPQLFRVDVDGRHLTQLSQGIAQGIDQFWLVNNHYIIAQTIEDHFKPTELYILNLNEQPAHWLNLSNSPTLSDYFWVISFESEWLYFATRDANSIEALDVYRMRIDGSEQAHLVTIPYYGTFVDWSPDGEWLWLQLVVDRAVRLYRLSVPDGTLERLTDMNIGRTVGWSADKEWFIFTAYDGFDAGIYRITADGRDLLELSAGMYYNNSPPEFSPDRSTLMVSSCPSVQCGADIYRLDIAAGTAFPTVNGDEDEYFVEWTPDGSKIVYLLSFQNAYGLQRQFFIADEDAQNAIPLTPGDDFADMVGWSPDGEWFIYSGVTRNTSRDLYRVRRDGRDRQHLTRNKNEVRFQAWSPSVDFVWKRTQSLIFGICSFGGGMAVALAVAFFRRSDKAT